MTEFINITKKYNGVSVIDGLSLSIQDGERIVIMGESGGGKTTLLNISAGLIKPDVGEFKTSDRIAVMFQEPRLLPTFTLRENVMAVLKGKDKAHLADKYISLVELDCHADKRPHELSGGMCQRVAYARFLAYAEETGATLLLLDEPFSSLDEEMTARMIEILLDFSKDKSVIYVTHNSAEAEKISDKIIRI